MYKRIGHIALRAKDIEASIIFYRDMLGMKEAFRMYDESGKLSTIYLCLAPGQFIEIFPGGIVEHETSNDTIGYSHLCVEVDDVDETFERLRPTGIPLDTEVKTGLSKSRMFWTHDPDGNRIEFMQLTPASLQAQAIDRLREE